MIIIQFIYWCFEKTKIIGHHQIGTVQSKNYWTKMCWKPSSRVEKMKSLQRFSISIFICIIYYVQFWYFILCFTYRTNARVIIVSDIYEYSYINYECRKNRFIRLTFKFLIHTRDLCKYVNIRSTFA